MYDIRCRRGGNEKGTSRRLTLCEEILLVTLQERGDYSLLNDKLSLVLRGSILVELYLQGRIKVIRNLHEDYPSKQIIKVIDGNKTGDNVLDETLNLLKNSKERNIEDWIYLLCGDSIRIWKRDLRLINVKERILKGMVDKNILKIERNNYLIFERIFYPIKLINEKLNIINSINNILNKKGISPSIEHEFLVYAIISADLIVDLSQGEGRKFHIDLVKKCKKYIVEKSNDYNSNNGCDIIQGVMMVFRDI
eukprot:GHVP01010809.1.p1 GENE.GHVP01010809.1~~GHVP01010809.1.p1  ORF type:complete len:263 (+),score=31.43 GHVP01010809.1:38-790(+)